MNKKEHTQADINRMVDLIEKGVRVDQIRQITGVPCTEQAALYKNYILNKKKHV